MGDSETSIFVDIIDFLHIGLYCFEKKHSGQILNTFIKNFQLLIPPFYQDQDLTLDWVASMHTQAEQIKNPSLDPHIFKEKILSLLSKIGLGKERIEKRHMFFDDFFKNDQKLMQIYNFQSSAFGKPISNRLELYDEKLGTAFEDLYSTVETAPTHLIHTTCTGYSSPSIAQKLVSKKGWGQKTQVTHAYHMGCYASIPSIRIGKSLMDDQASRIDIVHTEFCSLHMNPQLHTLQQLVIESLFADGIIKYSLCSELKENEKGLEILATLEQILPQSLDDMTWDVSEYSFDMTLSKDVPTKIANHLGSFVLQLLKKANVEKTEKIYYAIHPGGPKILDQVASILEIEPQDLNFSKQILKTRGNMSSATLPHVWQLMLEDPSVLDNSIILSLAFGPGLTMAGSIFRKKAS